MNSIFFLLLFLCGCSRVADDSWARLSSKKQKQRIVYLQKRLEAAQRDELAARLETERCTEAIEQAQIALVQKAIEEFEKRGGAVADVATLFLQEREILNRLIESGPSPAAIEAQVLLDQILRIITHASDEGRSIFFGG